MSNELKKKVQESINKNKLTEYMLIELSNNIKFLAEKCIHRSYQFRFFDIQCNISLDLVNVCMRMLVSPK